MTYINVYVLPFSHFDAFAIGALITQMKIPKALLQFRILSLIIPILGLSVLYLNTGRVDFSSMGYPMGLAGGYKFLWGYTLVNYYFAVIIYLIANENFAKWLDFKPVRYLGKISYGLYIYHFVVLYYAETLLTKILGINLVHEVDTFFALLITIVISHFSFYFIEGPINMLKDKFFVRGGQSISR